MRAGPALCSLWHVPDERGWGGHQAEQGVRGSGEGLRAKSHCASCIHRAPLAGKGGLFSSHLQEGTAAPWSGHAAPQCAVGLGAGASPAWASDSCHMGVSSRGHDAFLDETQYARGRCRVTPWSVVTWPSVALEGTLLASCPWSTGVRLIVQCL